MKLVNKLFLCAAWLAVGCQRTIPIVDPLTPPVITPSRTLRIVAFYPRYASPGDTLFVTAAGFNRDVSRLKLSFGTVPASIVQADAQQIAAIVPTGIAGGGKLALSSDTATVQSDSTFYLSEYKVISRFPDSARKYAFAFTLAGKAYVGGGETYENPTRFLRRMYCFDPASNTWTRKADFPSARSRATGFAVGGSGYVGLGFAGGQNVQFKDFYAYDPSADTWTRVADFPGSDRFLAVSFAVGATGYVGSGARFFQPTGFAATDLLDFYAYTPSTNSWAAVASMPSGNAPGRFESGAFTLEGLGFVGFGKHLASSLYNNIPIYVDDTYLYDPAQDRWSLVTRLPAPLPFNQDKTASNRYSPQFFSVNGKIYHNSRYTLDPNNQPNRDYRGYVLDVSQGKFVERKAFPPSQLITEGATGFYAGSSFYTLDRNNSIYQFTPQ